MNKKISKKNFTIEKIITTKTVKKYYTDILAQSAEEALAKASEDAEKAVHNSYGGDEGCVLVYNGGSRSSTRSVGNDLVSVDEEYKVIEE